MHPAFLLDIYSFKDLMVSARVDLAKRIRTLPNDHDILVVSTLIKCGFRLTATRYFNGIRSLSRSPPSLEKTILPTLPITFGIPTTSFG